MSPKIRKEMQKNQQKIPIISNTTAKYNVCYQSNEKTNVKNYITFAKMKRI
jgi:hypothetical protein